MTNQGGSVTDPIVFSTSSPLKYSGSTNSNPSLTVSSLASTDQGKYRCRASNLIDDTVHPRVICCPVNCEYDGWAIVTTGGVPSWIEKEESTHKKHRYLMIRKWISISIIFF
jgi:hypothetical protein